MRTTDLQAADSRFPSTCQHSFGRATHQLIERTHKNEATTQHRNDEAKQRPKQRRNERSHERSSKVCQSSFVKVRSSKFVRQSSKFEVRSSKFEVRSSKFEIKLAAFDRIVRCCIVPHGFALFRIVSHCSASFFGTVVVVLAVGCVFGSIEGKGSGAGGGHQGCVV